MRKFKFRLWDRVADEWEDSSILEVFRSSGELEALYGSEYIIQQFTGLKDKNGTEIFEGDIIRYNFGTEIPEEQTAEVYYDEKFACFCFDRSQEYDFIRGDLIAEVVGNIFEGIKPVHE